MKNGQAERRSNKMILSYLITFINGKILCKSSMRRYAKRKSTHIQSERKSCGLRLGIGMVTNAWWCQGNLQKVVANSDVMTAHTARLMAPEEQGGSSVCYRRTKCIASDGEGNFWELSGENGENKDDVLSHIRKGRRARSDFSAWEIGDGDWRWSVTT